MSIEEAIAQLIGLGEKDPLTIVDKLVHRYGEDWLREQSALRAHDVSADLARQMLGSVRRSSEIALRTGDQMSSSELKLRSYWVPESGYKRAADLTVDDLLVRASFYDKLAHASGIRAAWCRDVAGLMVAEGVKTLGKLKATLPMLPDDPSGALGEAA